MKTTKKGDPVKHKKKKKGMNKKESHMHEEVKVHADDKKAMPPKPPKHGARGK